jgi:hypothetical protein
MNYPLRILSLLLLATLAACSVSTSSEEPADLPEVRYYIIADV